MVSNMRLFNFFFIFLAFLLSFLSGLSAAPTISNISPMLGSSSGGTHIVIKGRGFTGTTAVSFGNTPASSFSVSSDTTLLVTSPSHVPQVVPIRVTSQGETSSIVQNAYYVYQGNWRVYVANSSSETISVVDPVENRVIQTLNVEQNPCYVAFSPDGSQAFVANETSNTLSVIDSMTQAVTSISSEGTFPNAVTFQPNGTKAYVINGNDGVIASIDTKTLTSAWEFSSGGNPRTLAITPDGKQLCITDVSANNIIFLNPDNGQLIDQTATSLLPDCIVIHPNGTKAYIANNGSHSISVINLSSNNVETTLSVGNNPCALAITPDGSILSVVNATDNTITLIDTHSDRVTATLPVGVFPKNAITTPDGSKEYIVNHTSGLLTIVDLANARINGASITVGNNPYAIAMLPDGSKTYVGNTGSNFLSIIETASDSVIASPVVGNFSTSIAVSPDPAPLANFTVQTDSKAKSITLNASSSASPVGSIANYFWDFGDGVTLSTSSPIIQHIYAAAGIYPVTLTVTNTAGTSTQQIYSHTSSHNFNFSRLIMTQSEVLTHNGGAIATTTQMVTIQPSPPPVINIFPPTHLHGEQFKVLSCNGFGFLNMLSWDPPKKGAHPVSYRIYKNHALTKLVGVVSAHEKNYFKEHKQKKHRLYKYFIVSVDRFGNRSEAASIVIHSDTKRKQAILDRDERSSESLLED